MLMVEREKGMPRSFVFALCLLTLSLGLNVTLAWKVRQVQVPKPPPTKVGVRVSSFAATDLVGHARNVSFENGKPTVIYYIDPECHWCKANAASFEALARAISGRMSVVVLSRRSEKIDLLFSGSHPDMSVLIVNSGSITRELDLGATPQTFVVSTTGRVEHHWYGAYGGETRRQIEEALEIDLPETSLSAAILHY